MRRTTNGGNKPCASCKSAPVANRLGWVPAGEDSAKWLQHDDVVQKYFRDLPGFYVDVPIMASATHVWTSTHLTADFKGPLPARRAYTGEVRGDIIQNVVGVKNITSGTIRLHAPVPYKDTDKKVYACHAHCRLTSGRVLTLPYLVPECGYTTAIKLALDNKKWKLVYVLNNQSAYSVSLLPRTRVLTSPASIAAHFKYKNTPLLVYCAKATCNASHRIARSLLRNYGFTTVAVFRGGMQEVERRQTV